MNHSKNYHESAGERVLTCLTFLRISTSRRKASASTGWSRIFFLSMILTAYLLPVSLSIPSFTTEKLPLWSANGVVVSSSLQDWHICKQQQKKKSHSLSEDVANIVLLEDLWEVLLLLLWFLAHHMEDKVCGVSQKHTKNRTGLMWKEPLEIRLRKPMKSSRLSATLTGTAPREISQP